MPHASCFADSYRAAPGLTGESLHRPCPIRSASFMHARACRRPNDYFINEVGMAIRFFDSWTKTWDKPTEERER
jgi:hypothetical protein